MNDSPAVLDPDRLPWLVDDHKPRGKRAWTAVLLLAILATLLLAGVSYWLGMESVRSTGDLAAQAPPARPAPPIQQPQPSTPGMDPLLAPAMPEVAPVAEPEVAPPPVTDQRPARPRPPPEQPVLSPPQSAPTAKPPASASAASATVQPRPAVQSRASFNCRLARARWEIAVCNNGDLATLDRDLAALTTDVWGRADAAKRARLARTRDRFILRRNACQSDACTNSAYVARLRELSDIMTGTVAKAPPAPSAAPAQVPPAKPKAVEQTSAATPPPKPAATKSTAPKTAAQPKAIAQSRASFDCRLARTRGEIAVCNNGNLGLLDRQLALLYSQAWGRADAAKRVRLLRTRDRFVTRRDACLSEMCTRIAYENRMRQVSDIMFGLDRQQ